MSKLQVETISHTNNTTAMTIDSSGRISQPVKPAFLARRSATTISGTDYTIPWNVTDGTLGSFDIGSNFNTSTYKYVVPIDGIYFFYMESITNTNVSSGTIQLREGTTSFQEAHITNENSTWQNHHILAMRNCDAGDEISCYSAGSINWYGNWFGQFGGFLIG